MKLLKMPLMGREKAKEKMTMIIIMLLELPRRTQIEHCMRSIWKTGFPLKVSQQQKNFEGLEPKIKKPNSFI